MSIEVITHICFYTQCRVYLKPLNLNSSKLSPVEKASTPTGATFSTNSQEEKKKRLCLSASIQRKAIIPGCPGTCSHSHSADANPCCCHCKLLSSRCRVCCCHSKLLSMCVCVHLTIRAGMLRVLILIPVSTGDQVACEVIEGYPAIHSFFDARNHLCP